jgi:type I restriction enzyme S subunit
VSADVFPLREILEKADSGVWAKDAPIDGVSILRSTNFTAEGEVDFSNLAIKDVDARDRERKLLIPGDILLEKSGGGPQQPVGRVAYFRGDVRPHVFGNFIARLRVKPELCASRFLFWLLRHSYANGVTERYQKQTTGIRNLETRRFFDLPVPLPPLEEQRRIVGLLDRAAEIRRRADAARAKARAIIPALFIDMFGDPATNPKGWPIGKIEENCDVQGGLQVTSKRSELPLEMPYLRVANVLRGTLDLSEIKPIRLTDAEWRRTQLAAGDILIVEGHGNPNEVGRAAIWDGSIEGCTHQNHLIRARPDKQRLLSEYLVHFLNSHSGRRILIGNGKTTSGLNTISTRNVKAVLLPIPPLPLQTAFAEQAQRLESTARALDTAAAKAEAMAASLSAKVFTASDDGNAAYG